MLSQLIHKLHPEAVADIERWRDDPELGKLRDALHAHADESVFYDTYAEALVARYLLTAGCSLKFEVPTPVGKHCDFEVIRGERQFYVHVKRMQTEPPEPRHVTISPRLRYLESIPRPYLVRVRWEDELSDEQMQRFVARAAKFINHARVGDELTIRDEGPESVELGGVQVVAPWSGSSVSLLIGLPRDFVDETPRIHKLLNRAYQQFMPKAMNMILICSMSRDDVGDFQNALLGSHVERWDTTPKPGQRIAHGRADDGFWHGGRFSESVVAGWFSFGAGDRDIHVRLWQRQDVVIDPPMQALLGEVFGGQRDAETERRRDGVKREQPARAASQPRTSSLSLFVSPSLLCTIPPCSTPESRSSPNCSSTTPPACSPGSTCSSRPSTCPTHRCSS